jgi:hypothetical protein
MRILLLLLAAASGVAAPRPAAALPAAAPQEPPAISPRAEPRALVLYAYTLRHQAPAEALDLVRPMLSAEGTVRLQTSTATLQIRDSAEVTRRIAAFLRSFDHPPLTLDLEVMVVRASSVAVSPQPANSPEIPAELLERWRNLLRYEHYQLMAKAQLEPKEGEEVTYEMGAGYRVSFRLGTLLANRRIKLHNFRLALAGEGPEEELIHTNLNPWLNQSASLGLARDESSRTALMVVVICRNPRAEPVAAAPDGDGKENR